jgi:hypothetical protein
MGEAQEVEGFRLALTMLLPSRGGEPPELDQPRLVGVQDQAEFPEALPQELFGLAAILKPDEEIVGVTHDDDRARGELGPPLLDPEVEDVMQKHIRQPR